MLPAIGTPPKPIHFLILARPSIIWNLQGPVPTMQVVNRLDEHAIRLKILFIDLDAKG
jgi:hypothetical protein